ncbi:hypothetical protein KSP39_PZI000078 [Platanthera zijinensis]|uniref:Uncharacterized protein n=1 Tax=Platanthera zijinensis TaxID=2320716 RepID=A0AAP0C4A0_9ASPA
MSSKRASRFLRSSHTMEVRSHNAEDNDPPDSRAIPYDVLSVGLGDIGKIKMLEKGVNGKTTLPGLTDIVFSSAASSRLLASGYDGGAYVWDMRLGNLPCLRFSTRWGYLNNIETDAEEQVLFGAAATGEILAWDIRGGSRISPRGDFKMAFDGGIQSIRRDPSCPRQLAFHVDGGGLGVFDLHSETITQLHYPTFNSDEKLIRPDDYKRRPTWMPKNSGSHTMEVISHNDEDNDPPDSRAIPYDALSVGLGDIGKIKITKAQKGASDQLAFIREEIFSKANASAGDASAGDVSASKSTKIRAHTQSMGALFHITSDIFRNYGYPSQSAWVEEK